MKRLYIITILLFTLFSISRAQTQFPFYGFELSNYEVGDSLEYYSDMWASGSYDCSSQMLYCIIGKEFFAGNDSVQYTVRTISNGLCNYNGNYHSTYEVDTINIVVNNDTVYKNDNNLLFLYLNPLPQKDSTNSNPNDSAYIRFDTINGRKHLKYNYEIFGGEIHTYEAEQDIGVENWNNAYEDQGANNSGGYLEFYRLAHGGIFKTLYQLYDNVISPSIQTSNISIRYDNDGNPFLLLSSTQNLSNPILSIFDLLGRNVKTQQVNTGSNLIDMQALPKGMYLYKVESNGNVLGQGKLMNMTN